METEQRNLFHWSLLGALLLLMAMAIPFWLGLVYTADDLGDFHLPLRKLYADELAQGRILAWTPELFGGFYVAGEGQVGVYHPLHLALYRFVNLRAAFCLEVLLSYPLMLIGTNLFLRRRRLAAGGAMFAALAFTFTGFNLLHFMHLNAIAVLAHLPWLLLAIDWLFTSPERRARCLAAVAIAVLTASQLLLGYPQFVWFTLLASFALIAYLLICEHGRRKSLIAWGAALLVAGMLAGIQLGPTLDVLAQSQRPDISRQALFVGSLHPWNLAQLVGPYLFRKRVVAQNTHELVLYVGVVPLLLSVWLLENFGRVRRHRRLVIGLVISTATAFLLALGEYGGLYQLQFLLPVVGKFRFASRYVALFALGIAALAGIAMEKLIRGTRRTLSDDLENAPCSAKWPLGVTVVGVILAVTAPWLWESENLGREWQRAIGPLFLTVAVCLLCLAQRGWRPAIVCLVLFTTIDLGIYGLSYAIYPGSEPLEEFAVFPDAPATSSRSRILADVENPARLRKGNRLLLSGWSRVDGYAGLEPMRRLSYRSVNQLRAANVRWVSRLPETNEIAGLLPAGEKWLEVPNPLGKVRLVTQTANSNSPERDLDSIKIERCALVDRPLELSATGAGEVLGWQEQPGEIVATVRTPSSQLLAVAESFHPGWEVRIDGHPTTLERVNGDFFGCVVPQGEHAVRFEFRPRSLIYGKFLSLLGVAVAAGWLGVGMWSRPGR